ncbi:lipoyl(octanoyl) transferase LipB [Desulfobacterales bacterium HSG17]|nr:lipoyl(octanoyl) transferase LipB [Desulfobacterales bacterium HSG17]
MKLIQAVNLGVIPYVDAHDLQVRLVDALYHGLIQHNMCLLVEHPPVFTLGRRGGRENIRVESSFLIQQSIGVVHTERGGDVTYHGPGQLVIYFILDLESMGISIPELVEKLEAVMIGLSSDAGITATRNPKNHGIWIKENKLGSIGLAIRRGITFHGLALNVKPDLAPFSWINPCGMAGVSTTSLLAETETNLDMDWMRKRAMIHISRVFSIDIKPTAYAKLTDLLNTLDEKEKGMAV